MQLKRFITGPLEVNTYCFSLSNNSLCLIDPGGDFDTLLAHTQQTNKTVSAIILTHGHLDHVIALPELKKNFVDAKIYIHEGDAKYLGKDGLRNHRSDFEKIGASAFIDQYGSPLPESDFLLEDKQILFDGCDDFPQGLQVIHTPGHTQGSVCFYSAQQNCLFSGDTLFQGTHGRTDLPGGSYRTMRETLQMLFQLPEKTIVYPGHNEFTSIKEEKSMRI
ncbi:MAG: MBL fold metallo-hydrolase [Treponemataceae bacterium]